MDGPAADYFLVYNSGRNHIKLNKIYATLGTSSGLGVVICGLHWRLIVRYGGPIWKWTNEVLSVSLVFLFGCCGLPRQKNEREGRGCIENGSLASHSGDHRVARPNEVLDVT